MEIKQGSGAIQLLIKPRVDGVVLTVTAWEALYGGTTGVYTLLAETADKTGTESITGAPSGDDGILFTLPASMFTSAQRSWTVSMKWVIQGITDFSLYNFDIKVTKPQSVNAR